MKKILLAGIMLLLLVSCFNNENTSFQKQTVAVQLMKSASIDVTAASCRVTSADMDTIETDLSVSPIQISGEISNVPFGQNRLFEISCFNSQGIMNYYGSTLADINNFAPVVNITLYPVEDSVATVTINGTFADEGETDEKIVFAANYSGDYDIYIMDTDGSNVERLTSDPKDELCPHLSPDRRKVAFQRASGEGIGPYCCIMDLQTKQIETLAFSDTFRTHYIHWHPDGNKIIFRSNARGGTLADIYSYDFIQDKVDTLIMNDARDWMPDYTPDGNSFLYASELTGTFRAYLANEDGSNSQMINPEISGEEKSPEMSPTNSNLVVYQSRHIGDVYTDLYDLYITDLSDNSIETLVSTPNSSEGGPCWSPDGSKVYFYRNYFGNYGIYSVDIATGNITKILDVEGEEMFLHCR
jgi:Tol biopolymer transport system component/galactitol-specific phosphotransferase system IIB component